MKIQILIPDNWMTEMIEPLKECFDIYTDGRTKCDYVWIGSESQLNRAVNYLFENQEVRVINYLWDLYSFKEYNPDYIKLLMFSTDIWTPTYDVSQDLKQKYDLKSFCVPAWFPISEWDGTEITQGDYVVQASRRDDYKRFDWFEKACEELNIPYVSCHPDKYSREEFRKIIAGCRFVAISSLEESQGTLSAMEGTFLNKPILMSDCIEGGKEVWGDTIEYFKWNKFRDYKEKLRNIYDGYYLGNVAKAYLKLLKNHSLGNFINNFKERIKKL